MRWRNNPRWKGGVSKNNYNYKMIQVRRLPERVRAREVLGSKAIQSGKIKRPDICPKCHQKRKIHAHHNDYSKPLDWIFGYAGHIIGNIMAVPTKNTNYL